MQFTLLLHTIINIISQFYTFRKTVRKFSKAKKRKLFVTVQFWTLRLLHCWCGVWLPWRGGHTLLLRIMMYNENLHEEEEPEEKALRHLDPRILETPAFAVENAVKEVVRMGEIVLKNLNRVTKEAMSGEPRQSKIDKVHNDEQVINHLEPMITEYLVKISHLAITEKEMKVVNNLFDSITDIERSGDHVENMAGYLQHIKDMNENISEDAIEELRNMNNIVRAAFESAIRAIEFDDTKEAKEALSYAEDVYCTRKIIRKRHIQRMKDGACSPDIGVYFLDIISSMERIAGYAFTIARYILSQNDEEE